MPISSFNDINDMHKSMLQEMCNMGTGNAATSLSQMILTATDIGVPQVKMNTPALAGIVADKLSKNALSYLIELREDIHGSLLFVFPYPFIERIAANYFPGLEIKDESGIDDMVLSFMGETVNIAAAAYANCISGMTGLLVDISPPEKLKAPSEKLFSPPEMNLPQICFVNNSIEILDAHSSNTVIFYPELESVNKIMEKFGL